MQSATPAKTADPSGGFSRSSLGSLLIWGLVLGVLAWSWQGAEIRPMALIGDSANMAEFAAGFFPPNFTDWRIHVSEMVVTVHIAVWGTLLALVCAVPLGLLSSSNIAPAWIYQPVRRLMDAARAINEMVFAMLFIVAVGLGPFAGVLALWVHTTGILAKLFSEAVEAIDPQPVEGIRATGANVLEEIVYGVIPQVMPLWVSYTLYRFESNVRSASVVGMVGAGGIGVTLYDVIRSFDYAQTCAVMLIIIAFVTVIDLISARIRKTLM
ncbi:MAG: phosphonate ABC transporter, permease protein PhnE [Gammaproteobacteria bacterium]|nr:phosphonate ABC transporter, permease protein PhnE [Gammaproteobacteria bacterium]MBU1414275.1 phosphonate ABC transporter, permease protein PhnE [Gammaproteobacteria bacterium]